MTQQPATVRCIGPNGTHYPKDCPYLYGDIPHSLVVPPSHNAIKQAIGSFNDQQVEEGACVLVLPGVLPGFGAGSSSPIVMQNVGSTARRNRILVTPANGWGSVTFSGSARYAKVYGVVFLGFEWTKDYGVMLTGCTNTDIAWSTGKAGRVCGLAGQETTNSNLIEFVVAHSQLGDSDPVGFGAGYVTDPAAIRTGSGWLVDCAAVGCYIAPQYLLPGGTGHNDGLQLYGSSVYGRFVLQDTFIAGSNNSALQIGGCSSDPAVLARLGDGAWLVIDYCLLLAGSVSAATRYPLPPEAKQGITGQAINGSGRAGYLEAYDTVCAGSVYTKDIRHKDWLHVERSSAPVDRACVLGHWTVDPSLSRMTSEQIDARGVPYPTDDYLRQIWSRPVPPPDPRVLNAVDRLDDAASDLFAAQTDNGTDITDERARWMVFRGSIPEDMR